MVAAPGTDGLLIMSLIRELMRSGIDVDYLRRWYKFALACYRNPEEANDGLFFEMDGEPQVLDRLTGNVVSYKTKDISVAMRGEVPLDVGGVATPVFVMMTETYMDDAYSPDTVNTVGISAARIRQFAADLADAAFAKEVVINQPWTDWKGEKHETMVGRPVAMHSMRGISAHSNGFQTCRACTFFNSCLDQLRCLAVAFQTSISKATEAHSKPAGKPDEIQAGKPLPGAPLGYVLGP